jgi:tetratricopeptide (TPR) repeat protein
VAAAAAVLLCLPLAAQARSCAQWHAAFVSVQGSVQIQRTGTAAWRTATQGQTICTGDSVRVNDFSRAAVRLPDKTVLRLDQNTTLTFSAPQDDTGTWVDVLLGVIHIISRDPRALRFNTPYANAGLQGTEFVIDVGKGQTSVTVVEGEVKMSNAAGTIGVPSGQRGTARGGAAPVSEEVADPFRALGWTPYFAPVLFTALPPPNAAPGPARANDAAFYAARAARRIAVGQVDAAEADIRKAASLAPADPRPRALLVPLALARGNKEAAMAYARMAVAANPRSAPALIALSHAQQAEFDLAAAQQSLEQAVAAAPANALAWARLAEIRFARGDRDAALTAAARAAQLAPGLAQVQTILGFSFLARDDRRAIGFFQRAAKLDQAAPLPRVGWALALIRRGRLEEGRKQLEIAVVLDPTNALVRSYMAKIYATEGRHTLADAQLRLARTLDASDPTAFLYHALTDQQANKPVAAVQALQTAARLNDERPVYRSRLRLDEDLAIRSAGLGHLYRSLGFGQLALNQGWRSTALEPTEYSGHRLLADVYSTLPRHQIARVDELYQSQLLQPLNVTPVLPQLAESNLFILGSMGPSELAHSEFVPLVTENGLSFQGSAIASGNNTHGEDIAVAGLGDKISYSVGRFDVATDGFRANNDLTQHVTNAFVQGRLNPKTSLLGEFRTSTTDKGDLRLLFDPSNFSPTLRQREDVDSTRLGFRHDLSGRNHLLGSFVYESGSNFGTTGPNFSTTYHTKTRNVDLQNLYSGTFWNLKTGARYFSQNALRDSQVAQSLAQLRYTVEQASAYAYATIRVASRVDATLGLSSDTLRGQNVDRHLLNPKLGLHWNVRGYTAIRAAIFRTLQGHFMSKQSIVPRLEPTHVVGFNQYLFAPEGESSWHYGLAVDHRFSQKLHGGVQMLRRDTNTPYPLILPQQPQRLEYVNAEDDSLRAYAYWTPASRISLGTEYQFEDIDNHGQVLNDGYSRLTTRRLPLKINYFPNSRLSAGLTAAYIDQSGYFSRAALAPSAPPVYGADSFWYFSCSLGYRLPRHHGSVALHVDNLLDKQFRFQDTDPEFTRFMPERMLSLRVTLAY